MKVLISDNLAPIGAKILKDAGIEVDTNTGLPPEELKGVPTVAGTLEQALAALDADRDFLKVGGVFTDDMIDGYIALKNEEVEYLNSNTHPAEFEMYYSL
jgi:glutamine synthetase